MRYLFLCLAFLIATAPVHCSDCQCVQPVQLASPPQFVVQPVVNHVQAVQVRSVQRVRVQAIQVQRIRQPVQIQRVRQVQVISH